MPALLKLQRWNVRVVTLLALLALFVSGCAHYKLGTGGELAFSRLYVAPVENEAVVPQAVALVTREIRRAFLTDGRVQLAASPDDADATLHVNLVNYGRTMTTARPEDTGLARKFDLTLEADLIVRDTRDGSPIVDTRRLSVTRQAFTDGDGFVVNGQRSPGGQNPAEYQTLPLLAQQLAERVTQAVLDTWE